MRAILLLLLSVIGVAAQIPPIEPGVSHELAKWRAARYSNVRYKLNLTLEKMSPVLKGTMEIRVNVSPGTQAPSPANAGSSGVDDVPIILDWRKIAGHEKSSTISNVTINGTSLDIYGSEAYHLDMIVNPYAIADREHLIFSKGVKLGENVIKLDFTSPILTSGSAITRYVDKEDGAEYIYSLFVPSDASTAFPVFDQPDLKARFTLDINTEHGWQVISNSESRRYKMECKAGNFCGAGHFFAETNPISTYVFAFAAGPFERQSEPPAVAGGLTRSATNLTEAKAASVCCVDPISRSAIVPLPSAVAGGLTRPTTKSAETKTSSPANSTNTNVQPPATAGGSDLPATRNVRPELKEAYKNSLMNDCCGIMTKEEAKAFRSESWEPLKTNIYVRKSQADKFKPHAAEVFRLNREGIKYLEQYFDYKFPSPKYDLVLIPEFPFGGMEHAGATFLREASIIFPTEPTKSDHISRANLIFHEAAHQWFGDTVTMKWFDDLWLKEGFAEFMAYKTLENVMPEANAWKVFYERNKQAAYLTDSTRGTTPIYQKIDNLSSAKSAYGNIVYRKAPSFLKQAEFYLGADKFQTAVRAFLKKYEYGNAGWEDLVKEFQSGRDDNIEAWAKQWVTVPGLPTIRTERLRGAINGCFSYIFRQTGPPGVPVRWQSQIRPLLVFENGKTWSKADTVRDSGSGASVCDAVNEDTEFRFVFPNYQDHGYGIFLLDARSRDYVLKNIQNEKDAFLRSMMWGALWDSVREGEMDPAVYIELAVKQLGGQVAEARASARAKSERGLLENDETIVASLLGRVSTALNYYVPAPDIALAHARASATDDVRSRFEAILLDRLQNAPTAGQRITFYRSFVANASTAKGREVFKQMLAQSVPPAPTGGALIPNAKTPPATAGGTDKPVAPPLRTKDRFDIVTRLIILGDPDALKLLAELEKTETTDDAKRYAYAARAGIGTAENKAKYWNDFTNNKDISESWIEAAFGPWNSIRHADLTLPYLDRALKELPTHKRNRKIFFINGWLGAFIGGQRSDEALAIVNKFLADNPSLDNDLRLKILENVDLIERAVKIRGKYSKN